MLDEDGHVHVLSLSDDIIVVAAHRFSTGSIEQALASYPIMWVSPMRCRDLYHALDGRVSAIGGSK